MCRQRSLPAARHRDHPARKRAARGLGTLQGMDSEEAAMADDQRNSRLGRGLAALIGDVGAESQSSERGARNARKVPIEFVRANPRNPRKLFSETELTELAASI